MLYLNFEISSQIGLIIVVSYNLFEIGRQFSTRGKEKSFTNVLSSNYMLRGYMCCNEKLFLNDPRAVPQISADYARTK